MQDVLGTGPVVAGFALATLTVGWPIAASQAGRIYLRIGFRACALIGCVLVIAGTSLLLLLDARSSVVQVALTCFLVGVGMGLVSVPTVIAAQSTVGWEERGVVTGNNLFSRSMGSALGVAVFGAIANATLGRGSASASGTSGGHSRAALTTATHHVLIGVAALAVLMTLAVLCMPDRRGAPDAGAEGTGAAGSNAARTGDFAARDSAESPSTPASAG